MAIQLTKAHADAARNILDHPIVTAIFDDIEASAINGAVNAKITDEITPAAYLAELRAIRALRSKLRFIVAMGKQHSTSSEEPQE